MKLFIWEYLDQVSSSYPSDGGLVVVAEDLNSAVEFAEKDKYVIIGDNPPDHIYDVNATEPRSVLVFPNAGCC